LLICTENLGCKYSTILSFKLFAIVIR